MTIWGEGGVILLPAVVQAVPEGLETGQVSVGTGATLICAARPGRRSVTLRNLTGTARVFAGGSNAVTTANGMLIVAAEGDGLVISGSMAIYGIAEGSAQTVSFAETF